VFFSFKDSAVITKKEEETLSLSYTFFLVCLLSQDFVTSCVLKHTNKTDSLEYLIYSENKKNKE